MQGPAQRHRREAQGKLGVTLGPAGRCRDGRGDAPLLGLSVDEVEEQAFSLVGRGLDAPVLAGPHDQLDVPGTTREQLVEVAFAVRHRRDAARLRQHRAGLTSPVDPALQFLGLRLALPTRRTHAFGPVPHLHRHQAQKSATAGFNRQHRVKQQSPRCAALADDAVTGRRRTSTAQRQFAGILDRHDVPARRPISRQSAGVPRHLLHRHRPVPQQTREPHLPRPRSPKSADARPGLQHQRRMQQGPPFCSRRSPKPPRPYSIPDIQLSARCASDRESNCLTPRNYDV